MARGPVAPSPPHFLRLCLTMSPSVSPKPPPVWEASRRYAWVSACSSWSSALARERLMRLPPSAMASTATVIAVPGGKALR